MPPYTVWNINIGKHRRRVAVTDIHAVQRLYWAPCCQLNVVWDWDLGISASALWSAFCRYVSGPWPSFSVFPCCLPRYKRVSCNPRRSFHTLFFFCGLSSAKNLPCFLWLAMGWGLPCTYSKDAAPDKLDCWQCMLRTCFPPYTVRLCIFVVGSTALSTPSWKRCLWRSRSQRLGLSFVGPKVEAWVCCCFVWFKRYWQHSGPAAAHKSHVLSVPNVSAALSQYCRMVQDPFIYFLNASPLSFSKNIRLRIRVETHADFVQKEYLQIFNHPTPPIFISICFAGNSSGQTIAHILVSIFLCILPGEFAFFLPLTAFQNFLE